MAPIYYGLKYSRGKAFLYNWLLGITRKFVVAIGIGKW
jgi:hypothetical protein